MPTIGETLKAAREARGLSLPEAGQATRIKTQQLDALERDDYRTIPAAPYARGFIKLYAQFLHLDPAPLLEQYNVRHGKASPPPAPTPTTPSRPRPPVKPAAPAAPAGPVSSATAAPAARVVPEPEPPPVAPPPPADPAPARDTFVPILPVAGVTPPPASPVRADELPLFDAPPAATPVTAAVAEELAPLAPAVGIAAVEPVSPVFPAFPAPPGAPEPAAPAPVDDSFFPPAAPAPAEVVQRDAEGAVEVVERFAPPSAADDRIEAARRADRQMRLRQAMLVVAAVLVFAGVLWLIRKLVRDSAPDAGELSGINARTRGLVAPPPEPYLEGR